MCALVFTCDWWTMRCRLYAVLPHWFRWDGNWSFQTSPSAIRECYINIYFIQMLIGICACALVLLHHLTIAANGAISTFKKQDQHEFKQFLLSVLHVAISFRLSIQHTILRYVTPHMHTHYILISERTYRMMYSEIYFRKFSFSQLAAAMHFSNIWYADNSWAWKNSAVLLPRFARK